MAKDEDEDDLLPDKDAAKEFYAKYEPKEILGRGISSTVRRCIEKETGRQYAAKIIDLSGAATEAGDTNPIHMLESTRQEISILRQVMGHPYIIELQDVFESDAFVFLVFELCSKGELFDYLTSVVTLSEKKTRTIMRQIFEGVEYIHSKNIVHRDLKPENILLDDNHNVKITDFGFARQMNDNEMLTDLCGTPGYLAPETLRCNMFEGVPGYGREVDIWACGVIMFTLLVGCPPFWHRKQMVMLRNIMEGKYSFTSPEWADISEEPKDLIRKCLVVDPAKRIKVREVLQHPFFNQMILLPELSYDGQKTTYHLCEQNVNSLRQYTKYIENNNNLYSMSTMQQQKQHQQQQLNNETIKQKLPAMHQQQQLQHLQVNRIEKQQQSQLQKSYNEYNLSSTSTSAASSSYHPIHNVTKAMNYAQTKSTYQTPSGFDVNNFKNNNNNNNNNIIINSSFKDYAFAAPTQPAPKVKIKHHYNHCQQQQQQQQQTQWQHQQQHMEDTFLNNYNGATLAYGHFPNTQQLRKQKCFNARKKFKFAMLVVRACIRIKRLHYTAEPLHVEDAIRDPYRIKVLRKIIDGCAFRVYGHWVKKGEGQNRAALFENTPRNELRALYVNNLTR